MEPVWKTAHDAFMAHIEKRPENASWSWAPPCRCHEGGVGTLRETAVNDGESVRGSVCPIGAPLWQAVRDACGITISRYGDTLTLYPGTTPQRWDDFKMSTCIGVHAYCSGFVDTVQISKDWNALRCRGCNWREPYPIRVTTIAELRAWARGERK